MKQLITCTTAYKTFSNDVKNGRLSHAYMLHLSDSYNLRNVLKIFALSFFGVTEEDADGRRILKETFTDCRIYPAQDKKLTAEAITELISDSALQPLERVNKLYVISGFNEASALIQNKLLKTLEEPPEGVYFILGVTSLAPVLDTVKSRVKTLTIPPFTENEIYSALERRKPNPLNAEAAKSCGGIFGEACKMVDGGWFKEITAAANEICTADNFGKAGIIAVKYGDTKHKAELLSEMGLLYYEALCQHANGEKKSGVAKVWQTPALIYAVESVDKACSDVKFNAFFQGLLYDLMLRIIEENNKWSKLQA